MEGGSHLVLPHHPVTPNGAPRCAQHQQKRHVGGRIGQNIGRIGNANAFGLGGGNIDMVGAHRKCRDHADGGGQGVDQLLPAGVHGGDEKSVKRLGLFGDFGGAHDLVADVKAGRKVAFEAAFHLGRKVAGYQNSCFGHCCHVLFALTSKVQII